MITKVYKICCDFCGKQIGDDYFHKPTSKDLIDKRIIKSNNSKIFCSPRCTNNYWKNNKKVMISLMD